MVTISHGVTEEFKCQNCGSVINFKTWLIIDGNEHPELIEKVKTEEIHDVYCHVCSWRIDSLDKPLMVFYQSPDPVLIYCPSEENTAKQDESIFIAFKTKFINEFQATYPQGSLHFPVLHLPRCALSVYLKEGMEAAEKRSRQEELERINSREEYASIIHQLIAARSFGELRNVIVPNYEMITSFRAVGYINEFIEGSSGKEREFLSAKKNILLDYRYMGFERTKADLEHYASLKPAPRKSIFGKLKDLFYM